MNSKITKINPVGTVIELISNKCAALVQAEIEIETQSGGGSSTATNDTSEETVILPARILTHGTQAMRQYFNYALGEKVAIMDAGGSSTIPDSMAEYDGEWRRFMREYENFIPHEVFILGAFYEEPYNLPAKYEEIFMVDFGGGNFIRYNAEDKELYIKCSSDVTILGDNIRLN